MARTAIRQFTSPRISKELFDVLSKDSDKGGKFTKGAIEEIRTALAAQKSGLIGGIAGRGGPGADVLSTEGLELSINSLHPGKVDDLLTRRKIGAVLAGQSDPNFRLLLDTRLVDAQETSRFVNALISNGVSKEIILIPAQNKFKPFKVGKELF